jgi:hypothetical protein
MELGFIFLVGARGTNQKNSFWWEQEEQIRKILDRLGVEYHIKNDSSIEDRGFNIRVKNEDHQRVTKTCLALENQCQREKPHQQKL